MELYREARSAEHKKTHVPLRNIVSEKKFCFSFFPRHFNLAL